VGISIVRFEHPEQGVRWGVVQGENVAVLGAAYPSHRELMDAYFSSPGSLGMEGLPRLPLGGLRLLAPVTRDVQIFCQGLAILLNFTRDEKRRDKLVKTQQSVRYLQPGDKLQLRLRSRDGALDLGTQHNEVRDAT
jgi:hypothetical protein